MSLTRWIKPLLCCTSVSLAVVSGSDLAKAHDFTDEIASRFSFTYSFTVTDIPQDAMAARIWVPLPKNDSLQTAQLTALEAPGPVRFTTEQKHGNRLMYCEVALPADRELTFSLMWDVTRKQIAAPVPAEADEPDANAYLGADKLVPLDGRVREFAADVAVGDEPAEAKGQALYTFTLEHMTYSKEGEGWGRGDVAWACDAGRGNCSDFHSLFIALSRMRGMPAKFEMGFPLGRTQSAGTVGGYHCWAKFYDAEHGWRPVDISEADKDASLASFFYGRLDPRRIHFTTGRDLILQPAQAGEPVNFLIYPYIEIDGRAHTGMTKAFRYDGYTPEYDPAHEH